MSEAPVLGNNSPRDTALVVQASSCIHHCPLNHNEFSYWTSPEAIKTYNSYEKQNDAKESVQNQIEF